MARSPFEGLRSAEQNQVWTWWEARRLKFNLALAAAGCVAFALAVVLSFVFRKPMWQNRREGLSVTLELGILFLVVMGIANICYLLGPALEATVRPTDPERFRVRLWRMGFWGSVALPFTFPAMVFAVLFGGG